MKGLNEKNEIKIDKLYKLRILVIVSFIIIFCTAVASITSWAVKFKPFEKFKHYELALVHGDTFEIEEVNIIRVGDSVRPILYQYRYEIDGITYIRQFKRGSSHFVKITFDYLVSDPAYTVASRTLALIMLPIVFILLLLADFVIVKLYLKERKQFIDYNYSKMSIFGDKHGRE